MSHAEEFRSADGGSSRFVIRNAEGNETVIAQRDGDLLKVWHSHDGGELGWTIGNEDALALGDWLAEARPWAEYGRPGPAGSAGHQ